MLKVLLICGFSAGSLAAAQELQIKQGTVYSYIKDEVRHYTTKLPEGVDPTTARTIKYSYIDDPKWSYVGHNPSVTLAYDKESYVRRGTIAKAWIREDYSTPALDAPIKGAVKLLWLAETDCGDRTQRVLNAIAYGKVGNVIHRQGTMGTFEPVVPDSRGEQVWKVICEVKANG
ncbi:hypothetical protein JI752_009555 [Lysobacter sp. MMG2]|uniref:surface-adhesin E family protein n=1 Tax=Lysobacter sp. MMG2 TaxID=2801338 RepID=UPI001C2492F6|nr:surface-adhesin E family protein [Lysobacter sp. MMG2]MBU8976382.1 hypothetical protein [Lysobacter sp. MMG2]